MQDHDADGIFDVACPGPTWNSELYTQLCALVERASETHGRNKKVCAAVKRCHRGLVLDPDVAAGGSCAVA